jgi:hypothetical protein
MLVVLMVFLSAALAQVAPAEVKQAEEIEGISIRQIVPESARLLPRREATEFCSEEAREALRQMGLGMLPPDGYEPPEYTPSASRCELSGSACAYQESEPWCYDGFVDTFNGGCNSSPYAFEILTPSYGIIEVAGTSGTYDFGGLTYRDTDWYEITIPEQLTVSWKCTAEFPLFMVLIDAGSGCPPTGYTYIQADECVEGEFSLNLFPGVNWLFVAVDGWVPTPCGADYVMTFEGLHAAPDCVGACPFGSVEEQEPRCEPEYYDGFNGGCNSYPPVFSPLEPHDGQIVLCGEGGVYPYSGICYRDTDWYELVLDEPRDIDFCIMAGFDYQLLIVEHADGCSNYYAIETLQGPPCDVACDTYSLDPGVYSLWVGSWSWLPVDCGRKYVVTIDGYTTPVEDRTWGSVKALYR